jgi:ABC-type molybdenum transport system ATPase subunit/photorepair protein PhrA
MPRSLTIRQVVESAWADTFRSKPKLDDASAAQVDAVLHWFEPELSPASTKHEKTSQLSWASHYMFGELSFSAQRVLLFLRAIIKHPDIVVLDEAFSGMDDAVRDKCMQFLTKGCPASDTEVTGLSNQQALICISHVKEEVPDCVREWLCLPEANTGKPAKFGRLHGPLRSDRRRWEEIWS